MNKKDSPKKRTRTKHKSLFILAIVLTCIISAGVILFGFIAENCELKIFHNVRLSVFMRKCFIQHTYLKGSTDEIPEGFVQEECYKVGYILYYSILYFVICLYSVIAIIICAKTNKIKWCAYAMFLSVLFLIFTDAYLTMMLEYPSIDKGSAIYQIHMTSFISIATIVSGIAGFRISHLFKQKEEKNKND